MEYEIKPKEKLTLGIAELWQYRELFYFFTWRDIKVKYKQTVLGFAWALLQPLLMMLVFTLFLGNILNFEKLNIKIPYPVYVYSGLIIWNIFSTGVTNAGNSMVSNANIIKKIYFPRLIIPISSILVSLFDFVITLFILIALLLFYRIDISFPNLIFFFFLGIIIASISTFGIGSFLAALNIKYRDFRYIIPFMVQAMLFITPVIYPISINNKFLTYLFACNPMYSAVELFRHSITNNPLNIQLIVISSCSSLLFLLIGLAYFRKTEAYFADLA